MEEGSPMACNFVAMQILTVALHVICILCAS